MPQIYLAKADQDKSKKKPTSKFAAIAKFLSTKSDDGQNDSDNDKGDMLDDNCKAKKTVEVDDAGPSCDSDCPGNDDGNEFTKSDSKDGDGPDAERDLASLDTPTTKVGHSVVPPYNKEASPETDPSNEVPNVEPPTRDETTPSQADDKKFGMDEDEDKACEASEKIWLSIAYIPQADRDQIDEADFAGPHRSFPCSTPEQVKNASHLVGHSKNPTSVKRKIIEIAKRKGFTHALPDSWKAADEQSHASIYDQAIALFAKLSAEEKKALSDKLDFKEQAVNGPQETSPSP